MSTEQQKLNNPYNSSLIRLFVPKYILFTILEAVFLSWAWNYTAVPVLSVGQLSIAGALVALCAIRLIFKDMLRLRIIELMLLDIREINRFQASNSSFQFNSLIQIVKGYIAGDKTPPPEDK
jgi:hypothetical protein